MKAICLRYFPKLLEEHLVFRGIIMAWYFLLTLKTMTMCSELNVFQKNLTDKVYQQFITWKYCRLIPEQESITDFLWGQSHLQTFQKIVSVGVTFQSKHRSFEITATTDLNTKTLENIQKCLQWSFLLMKLQDDILKPTTNLKNPLQISEIYSSGTVKKGKNVLKFR